jgi:hypothetical protein
VSAKVGDRFGGSDSVEAAERTEMNAFVEHGAVAAATTCQPGSDQHGE